MEDECPCWWEGFVCGCIVVAAICVARPYAEMGFIDDWSYVKTAFQYARTGHFVYNGWATAMLGWQIPWGALFVKLFGYSFTATRLSMLPVDLASVWLCYSVLVRFGITRWNAVFGTLTLGLSPLFVPLGASYMTDVPGLFVILLCLYLCLRALAAEDDRSALVWLALAAGTNVLGGTVRQIAWLGSLVMVPSTAWLMRHRRYVAVTTAGLWVLSLAGVLLCLRWWSRQPYSVPERILQGPVSGAMVAHLGAELLKAALCTCLLLLPVLVAWLPRYKSLPKQTQFTIAALLMALIGAASTFYVHGTLEHRVAPWLGHIIGTESMFSSTGEMLGTRPVTLNLFCRTALSLVVIGSVLVWLFDLRTFRNRQVIGSYTGSRRLCVAGWMLLPFITAYWCLLVPRGLYSFIYDRYLLGIFPAAVALILLLRESQGLGSLPRWTSLVLAISSLYVVAATHDWFALNRARVQAVDAVRASGVPVTRIQGGFDFDGWTQLQNARSINWAAVQIPPGTYSPDAPDSGLAPPCRLDFAAYTPAIRPDYFVVFSPMPCLADTRFSPISYSNWLPPRVRQVYIRRRPGQPTN